MHDDPTLTLIAGGDVGPVKQPVNDLADLILPTLEGADFRFAQCERTYSSRGTYTHWEMIPRSSRHARLDPDFASVFPHAGIDVVSVASNHAMAWGYEPLADTIAFFRERGMYVVGAGDTEEQARRPALLEKDGVKVAVLAYCSILRDGQAAIDEQPGVASIRARTWYEPIDWQPGCPPLVMSAPLGRDVEAMERDIRMAKEQADAVVVSIHWGVRFIPKILAAYQPPVAHAAIDAGADVVIGHGPHTLKPIEVYKGKVCFYSIGNFLTTGPHGNYKRTRKSHAMWNVFWYDYDPSVNYRFPAQCRELVLPKLTFSRSGVQRVAMVPAIINDEAQPRALQPDEPEFSTLMNTLEWVSDFVPHTFQVDGSEILVTE